ncbi:MAG: ribosomal protein S18 acetylase RimI-like enzyme [Polaribacter sp.]|jgi:ribosomal protein S18 acetylase RimI-like enzyme
MILRLAQLQDLATLRVFEQGVIAAERPFALNLKVGDLYYYDIEALIKDDCSALTVAEQDGELLACGYAKLQDSKPHIHPDKYAYLGFMYVVPQQRGKQIIDKVIKALITWASDQGVSAFELDVYSTNESAIRAYQRLGFKPNLVQMIKL